MWTPVHHYIICLLLFQCILTAPCVKTMTSDILENQLSLGYANRSAVLFRLELYHVTPLIFGQNICAVILLYVTECKRLSSNCFCSCACVNVDKYLQKKKHISEIMRFRLWISLACFFNRNVSLTSRLP